MTKNEISAYLDRVIQRAKTEKTKKSIDELLFEVYKTVAQNYNNKMPKSVLEIFTSKSITFNRFLLDKMKKYSKEVQDAQNSEEALSKRVKELSDQIDKIDAKKISVGFVGFSPEAKK